MPRARFTRREATVLGIFVVAAVAFLYFGLPQIAGLHDTWDRIRDGDPKWLFACLVFELISFGGYVWLFRTVFLRGEQPHRLAEPLRDHDGRAGGDAAVRRRPAPAASRSRSGRCASRACERGSVADQDGRVHT